MAAPPRPYGTEPYGIGPYSVWGLAEGAAAGALALPGAAAARVVQRRGGVGLILLDGVAGPAVRPGEPAAAGALRLAGRASALGVHVRGGAATIRLAGRARGHIRFGPLPVPPCAPWIEAPGGDCAASFAPIAPAPCAPWAEAHRPGGCPIHA